MSFKIGIALAVFVVICFIAQLCSKPPANQTIVTPTRTIVVNGTIHAVVVIDGCEYLECGGSGLIHKGNCSNHSK